MADLRTKLNPNKGDVAGHEFHGNQWTNRTGGDVGDPAGHYDAASIVARGDAIAERLLKEKPQVLRVNRDWHELDKQTQGEVVDAYVNEQLGQYKMGVEDQMVAAVIMPEIARVHLDRDYQESHFAVWAGAEMGLTAEETKAVSKWDDKTGLKIDWSNKLFGHGNNEAAWRDYVQAQMWDAARAAAWQWVREPAQQQTATAMADEQLRAVFDAKYESEKSERAAFYVPMAPETARLPTTWKPFADGSEYKRTQTVISQIQYERTAELLKERGLKSFPEEPGQIAAEVWGDWKQSSSDNLGLALQYATEMELGGKSRLSDSEKRNAINSANARLGSAEGMAKLRCHVRATWESSQYVLAKAGAKDVTVYRGLMLPGAEVNAGGIAERFGEHDTRAYRQLPDIHLLKNGAASTSSLPEVANNWGGIGPKPLDDRRVVLRINAPREAVLSLPVHGANIHGEQEVVLAGTKWNAWDAWEDTAPEPGKLPLTKAVAVAKKIVVIDLYEIERGQPHWLSKPAAARVAFSYDSFVADLRVTCKDKGHDLLVSGFR